MSAIDDVIAERKRQVEAERWTAEHDDQHGTGALAAGGACYALLAASRAAGQFGSEYWRDRYARDARALWPWDEEWWKPKDSRRDLIRAAALIVAEIERLDRSTKDSPDAPG